MSETKKSSIDWTMLAVGILILVMGILFIVFPDRSSNVIRVVFAIALFVTAIVLIVGIFTKKSKNIAASVTLAFLAILVGIYFLTNATNFESLIQLVFALILVYNGVTVLVEGIKRIQAKSKGSGLFMLILGIIITALGCVVMFGAFSFVIVLMGISLIIDGISLGILAFMAKKPVEVEIVEVK